MTNSAEIVSMIHVTGGKHFEIKRLKVIEVTLTITHELVADKSTSREHIATSNFDLKLSNNSVLCTLRRGV